MCLDDRWLLGFASLFVRNHGIGARCRTVRRHLMDVMRLYDRWIVGNSDRCLNDRWLLVDGSDRLLGDRWLLVDGSDRLLDDRWLHRFIRLFGQNDDTLAGRRPSK